MGPAESALSHGQVQTILWASLAAVAMFFLIAFLIFLCSSCDREKKPRLHSGDHENLMNVPSDKEMFSRSATSLVTDPLASSEQNGVLTNGDILSEDSTLTCMQPYEEVQTSASDLLDSQDSTGKPKSHQSRELPSLPPESTVDTMLTTRSIDAEPGPGVEGPYEVLKDSSSQENIVEDCLYETVKEIKEVAAVAQLDKGHDKSKSISSLKDLPTEGPPTEGKAEFVEYASVDRNKKCRQSTNAESILGTPCEPEEEAPPPVPVKLLDENENLQTEDRGAEEQAAQWTSETNKRYSSLSYKSREEDPTLTEEEISAMYSSVNKPGQSVHKSGQSLQAPESDFNSIKGAPERSPSSCNDLYATVKDFEKTPNSVPIHPPARRPSEEPEPDYEAIHTLTREEDRVSLETNGPHSLMPKENDYESIGDLQQCRDVTRL